MIGLMVVTCLIQFSAVVAVLPTTVCALVVAEMSCSRKAEKLSKLSDGVGCTEGQDKATGSQPELVTDEVVSITLGLAKVDDGNDDFAEAHGDTACIEVDSVNDDGNIEFTEAHDTFTRPGLATGDGKVDFTETEDEVVGFASLGVEMCDGDVDTREA